MMGDFPVDQLFDIPVFLQCLNSRLGRGQKKKSVI
jgi:hypothetical protein